MNATLTIGRLAEQADVGPDTIRFYERRGLLPAPERTPSGYRIYADDTVERLRFIRRAKSLGFSLEEIRALLDLHDNGGPKAEVKALTHRKLTEIDARIDDLRRIRDVLKTLNGQCSGHGTIDSCPIIEALQQ
jgi:Hg(II)-responsive transcriptional regulator